MSSTANESLAGFVARVRAALAWWVGELRSVYLDACRQAAALAHSTIVIEAGEHAWTVRRKQARLGAIERDATGQGDDIRALQRLVADAGRIRSTILLIPPERVLSKIVEIPAGARGELDRVLSFEISRHFPLPAERIYYGYRLISPPRGSTAIPGSPLSVEIVAVSREVVLSIVEELTAVGLRPSGIGLQGAPNATPLFLPTPLPATRSQPSFAGRAGAAATALLAVAAVASWPAAQQVRLAAIEREIAELKPHAEAALRAREAHLRDADQAAEIARLRAERRPMIAVLDTLTRELPDGSWLTSLSITGREIVLEGFTPSAATVARGLSLNSSFDGIVFRSPIARDLATGLEHFQFGATLKEPPQ